MTRRKGRAILVQSLKDMVRPLLAFLAGTVSAAIAGALVVTFSQTTPEALNVHKSGLFLFFFYSLLVALAVTVPRSLPIWILLFVPSWLFRLRIPGFWRWRIAPVVGGVLNIVSMELWHRVVPLDDRPEPTRGLMLGYYAGAAVGGVCMFAIGCIRSRRRSPLGGLKEMEAVARD